MILKYLLPLCLLVTPCSAQQQQISPAETALQINGVVSQWATTLIQQGRVIDDLQKQIAAKDAKIKELEAAKESK